MFYSSFRKVKTNTFIFKKKKKMLCQLQNNFLSKRFLFLLKNMHFKNFTAQNLRFVNPIKNHYLSKFYSTYEIASSKYADKNMLRYISIKVKIFQFPSAKKKKKQISERYLVLSITIPFRIFNNSFLKPSKLPQCKNFKNFLSF